MLVTMFGRLMVFSGCLSFMTFAAGAEGDGGKSANQYFFHIVSVYKLETCRTDGISHFLVFYFSLDSRSARREIH